MPAAAGAGGSTDRDPADNGQTVNRLDDGQRYVALGLALRLNSFPGLANQIRRSPVPPGMLLVIRIASGCRETRADAAAATGQDERLITSAAILLVSLFLGDSGRDPRRILCVQPHMPVEEVRSHMKWLLQWLHPDRNGQAPISSMAGRVIDAWGQVKAAEPTAPALPTPDERGGKRSKKLNSKWRAVPLSVRRARIEAAAGIEKVRRDVANELQELRKSDRSLLDDV